MAHIGFFHEQERGGDHEHHLAERLPQEVPAVASARGVEDTVRRQKEAEEKHFVHDHHGVEDDGVEVVALVGGGGFGDEEVGFFGGAEKGQGRKLCDSG